MRVGLTVVLLVALITSVAMGLTLGIKTLPLSVAAEAILNANFADPLHIIVRELRLPRIAAAVIAGLALGVSGVLMQTLTRNPLADPGLLGVNAGASLAVVLASMVTAGLSASELSFFAFPGAALAAVVVFLLAGSSGAGGPARLVLAGAALNAFLLSLVGTLVLLRSESLDLYRFWVVGSLAEAATRPLLLMAGLVLLGLLLALLIAPLLDTLSLGDEAAQALGTNLGITRGVSLLAITLLAGAAVCVAGPLAFLGLLVPPIARCLAGSTTRSMLCVALFVGPIILVLADLVGRTVLPPGEVQVGIILAMLGGPAFIVFARRLNGGAAS